MTTARSHTPAMTVSTDRKSGLLGELCLQGGSVLSAPGLSRGWAGVWRFGGGQPFCGLGNLHFN